MSTSELNRRDFLRVSAEAGAALVIAVQFPWADELAAAEAAELQATVWLKIDGEGLVWVMLDKCELGQGEMTALPMILADELEADWSKIRTVHIPTDPSTWVRRMQTGGSTGVRTTWEFMRKAGATARELLRSAAAAEWNVPVEQCRAVEGTIEHAGTGRKLAYGRLVARAAQLPVPENPPLKPTSEFRIIGKGKIRLDMPEKVDGSLKYGSDLVLPGMLYAVVTRPPAFGAKLVSVDDAAARATADVVDVLTIPQGVAVVAKSTWAALQGRSALKVTWDSSPAAGLSSTALYEACSELVHAPAARAIKNVGDVDAAMTGAAKRIAAEYRVPFMDHAVMEPLNATAHVHDGTVEVWVPTQSPTAAQQTAAEVAGVAPGKVTLHVPLVGSGFGRRLNTDDTALAVEVAKRVTAPVRVWCPRADVTKNGFYRPLSVHLLRGGLDAQGNLVAWLHRSAGAGAQGLIASGSDNPGYDIPNLRAEFTEKQTAVPVGAWRSVAYTHMGFVQESFMDELAHEAGQDPLAFRLKYMPAGKLRQCLELVAEKANWGRPAPGRFQGIAATSSFASHAAEVAEVSVSPAGEVKVHRVVVAAHVGQVVQPDNIASQTEGAIVLALGYTLKHEITVVDGVVQQTGFSDYPLLRIDEMPLVEVYTVPSTEPPTGSGEPPVPPLPAAVCNAIFAATGKRIRQLPIRPADLKRG
ncbi:MAG: xanthine dehydrogenase family protein molybdopterin-binding subunit [Gemmatimonadetes bacterium]|nr:xanthine dehydrogenase family protein molybdopterin-binding subunit [Gemmatimonadota bacterium]